MTFSNALPCVGRQTVSSLSFNIATESSRAPTLDQETASSSRPSGHEIRQRETVVWTLATPGGLMGNTTSSVNVEKKGWPHVPQPTVANLNDEIILRRCCHYTLVLKH